MVQGEAQKRGLANMRTAYAKAEALPFEDASFDLVTCRIAPHHFDWIAHFLAEVHRVLKPGGAAGDRRQCRAGGQRRRLHQRLRALPRPEPSARLDHGGMARRACGGAGFKVTHDEQIAKKMEFKRWAARHDATMQALLRAMLKELTPEVNAVLGPKGDGDDLTFRLCEGLFVAKHNKTDKTKPPAPFGTGGNFLAVSGVGYIFFFSFAGAPCAPYTRSVQGSQAGAVIGGVDQPAADDRNDAGSLPGCGLREGQFALADEDAAAHHRRQHQAARGGRRPRRPTCFSSSGALFQLQGGDDAPLIGQRSERCRRRTKAPRQTRGSTLRWRRERITAGLAGGPPGVATKATVNGGKNGDTQRHQSTSSPRRHLAHIVMPFERARSEESCGAAPGLFRATTTARWG